MWGKSTSSRISQSIADCRTEGLKNYIGLRRLRLRRMRFVLEQFYLAATVQNLKRLVRFLSSKLTPQFATA
jgi:hypothetical protein